jgi:hypothetical protein
MLVDNRCSIYEHRPRTCRTYDCRVFAAAGVAVDEDAKALIAERAHRWRFDFPTDADRVRHVAVQAAARSLTGEASSTERAVRAVEIYEEFLE